MHARRPPRQDPVTPLRLHQSSETTVSGSTRDVVVVLRDRAHGLGDGALALEPLEAERFSTLVAPQSVPHSSARAFHLRRVPLRVDKKKQTSRCNLMVWFCLLDSPMVPIAFSRDALSGNTMESFNGRLFFHRCRRRQLPLGGDVRNTRCSLSLRARGRASRRRRVGHWESVCVCKGPAGAVCGHGAIVGLCSRESCA